MTETGRPTPAGAGVGALCVLAASLLWGTTGTSATFAPDVGPLAIGAVAMGLGGLLQALIAAPRIATEKPQLRTQRGVVLLGALAVATYPLAFYTSMHLAGVAAGTVVSIGSAPLASAVIERLADGRRLTRRWMSGAALGLTGTALLCAAEAASAGSGDQARSATTTVVGVALGLVAGLTYALYSWAAHRLISRGVTARAAMGTVFGIGGVLLMPVLLATGAPLLVSWTSAGVGLYMALVPMFTGYVLFGWGLAHVPASTATTLSLLEPTVAAILAVLVVGERLPVLGWLGIGMVVACLAVLTVPTRRTGRRSGSLVVERSAAGRGRDGCAGATDTAAATDTDTDTGTESVAAPTPSA
ncbi:DMT family transporter [Streptomyces sp. NPDC059897]|uniref:DMT family transporter n=1 Tax=Streptomyces sp. NPDC059897 TaxID=3346994 RepID=UPI0036535387